MNLVEIVQRFSATKAKNNGGYMAKCPAHDDETESLSIDQKEDKILLKCFAGCRQEAIVQAAHLEMKDLFDRNGNGKLGLTLAELSKEKGLSLKTLKKYASDGKWKEKGIEYPAVYIRYWDIDGKPLKNQRVRIGLHGVGWRWTGGKVSPYGLWRLNEAKKKGYIVLVEGESDCWTLWETDFPGLGFPGATTADKYLLPEYLKGIGKVYLVHEPDKGGDTFTQKIRDRLTAIEYKGEVKELRLPYKDPNEMFCHNPSTFRQDFQRILDEEIPVEICRICGEEILNLPHFCKPKIQEIESEEIEKPEGKQEILLDTNKIHPAFYPYWEETGKNEGFREYIMATFLISVANACGNRITLQTGHGIRPNLYMLLLGDSTFMRKTTSMAYGIAALKAIANEKKEAWSNAYEKYEHDLEEYNSLGKKEKAAAEKPEKPKDTANIYPDEFSPEMLLEKMVDKPDGIFCYSEIGKLLATLDAGYMAGFKERLTDFFDAAHEVYIRETKSGGVKKIKRPCPSMIGCSTFQWLQKHLEQEDLLSGFLARFVMIARRDFPKEEVSLPEYFQAGQKWIDLLKKIEQISGDLHLTEEAKTSYDVWYRAFVRDAKTKDKFLHSFLGRLTTVCHKIAMINHILDHTCFGPKHSPFGAITAEQYSQAYTWIEFFRQNIENCYDEIIAGDNLQETKVMEIIRKKGVKEGKYIILAQYKICQFANMKLKDLQEVFASLIEKKYVRKIEKGKRTFWGVVQD